MKNYWTLTFELFSGFAKFTHVLLDLLVLHLLTVRRTISEGGLKLLLVPLDLLLDGVDVLHENLDSTLAWGRVVVLATWGCTGVHEGQGGPGGHHDVIIVSAVPTLLHNIVVIKAAVAEKDRMLVNSLG